MRYDVKKGDMSKINVVSSNSSGSEIELELNKEIYPNLPDFYGVFEAKINGSSHQDVRVIGGGGGSHKPEILTVSLTAPVTPADKLTLNYKSTGNDDQDIISTEGQKLLDFQDLEINIKNNDSQAPYPINGSGKGKFIEIEFNEDLFFTSRHSSLLNHLKVTSANNHDNEDWGIFSAETSFFAPRKLGIYLEKILPSNENIKVQYFSQPNDQYVNTLQDVYGNDTDNFSVNITPSEHVPNSPTILSIEKSLINDKAIILNFSDDVTYEGFIPLPDKNAFSVTQDENNIDIRALGSADIREDPQSLTLYTDSPVLSLENMVITYTDDGNVPLTDREGDKLNNFKGVYIDNEFIIATDQTKIGTSGNDTLELNYSGYAYGLAGHDIILGSEYPNMLYGGDGNDMIEGGSNEDSIYGQNDADIINGGGADDNLYGGNGADTINGGDGKDFINGGDGNDYLNPGIGRLELIYGGLGDDMIHEGMPELNQYQQKVGILSVFGDIGFDTLRLRNNEELYTLEKGERPSSSSILRNEYKITNNSNGYITHFESIEALQFADKYRLLNRPNIQIKQRHTDISGGDYLKLGYALKGNDDTGNSGGKASSLGVNDDGLTNVAVLGPNTSSAKSYTLEISAESLKEGWNLESTDIVLKYNTDLFDSITASDITLASELPIKNSISIDDENGLIRFAAASLSDISGNAVNLADPSINNGSAITGENILASINVNFDESYFNDTARNPDANGKFTFEGNPLGFELVANSDETVFSRTFDSDADGKEVAGGAYTNREIKSLGDLNGGTTFDEGKVNLYQAEIKFDEQDGGLTFGTKRVIGANQGFTNLIRQGDTVTAQTSIENVGNSLAKGVNIQNAGNVDNAKFVTSRFIEKATSSNNISITLGTDINLGGGVFSDSQFIHEGDKLPTAVMVGSSLAAGDVFVYGNGINYVDGYNFGSSPKGNTPQFTFLEPGSQSRDLAAGDYIIRGDFTRGTNVFTKTLTGSDAFLFQHSGGDLNRAENFNENSVIFMGQGSVNAADFSYDFGASSDELKNAFNFSYNSDSQESVNIEVDMKATGDAGSVIDVTKGLFQVTAAGMNQNPDTDDTPKVFVSESGSKNLITFQGDLNYDGRVSMKDLAFLNAGAARQVENTDGSVDAASVARDVDADFSGKIDIADLSILDQDWGKSLHTGTENFTGSSASLDWTTLEKQGDASWDNSSFTAQNAIEAQDSYIGSLDAPASTPIGGDNTSNDDGRNETVFEQDSLAVA